MRSLIPSAAPDHGRPYRAVAAPPSEPGTNRGRNYALHVRSVERVIRAMTQQLDTRMSNDDMADIACLSACHFNRVFHRLTGIPPIQFHYALRLQRAKELLLGSDLCITEICFEVGYQSLGTFVSRFNELVGLPPNAFRRFARDLSRLAIAELRPHLSGCRRDHAQAHAHAHALTGSLAGGEGGIAFVGLFGRGIPEGRPAACAIAVDTTFYSLPMAREGQWFAFSIAVPWTASGKELLMLDAMPRGRTGPVFFADDRLWGDGSIVLRPPSILDPPVLATIPLLLGLHDGIVGAIVPPRAFGARRPHPAPNRSISKKIRAGGSH